MSDKIFLTLRSLKEQTFERSLYIKFKTKIKMFKIN